MGSRSISQSSELTIDPRKLKLAKSLILAFLRMLSWTRSKPKHNSIRTKNRRLPNYIFYFFLLIKMLFKVGNDFGWAGPRVVDGSGPQASFPENLEPSLVLIFLGLGRSSSLSGLSWLGSLFFLGAVGLLLVASLLRWELSHVVLFQVSSKSLKLVKIGKSLQLHIFSSLPRWHHCMASSRPQREQPIGLQGSC